MILLWLLTLAWAVVATWMVIRNPLPFPDHGHRAFGVPNKKAEETVVDILEEAGLKVRFRFRSGPSEHTLFWDNMTDIHRVDSSVQASLSGNGISVVVKDPEAAATRATERLEAAGFLVQRVDWGLSPKYLIVLTSDAFRDWALVFRRHQLRLPKPIFLK